MTYNQCNFQQMKFSISMMSWLTFSSFSNDMFIVYVLWMTSILFDVNMYCRFFSMSKLVNWVINDPLVHNVLKNRKFSYVVHMLVDLKVQSCKLYNNKYMFTSTQLTETFPFIVLLVFKLLSRKCLFISKKTI